VLPIAPFLASVKKVFVPIPGTALNPEIICLWFLSKDPDSL